MILVLSGATGTGKSALAIRLAEALDGEIINADAFQVYQELSIATALPTKEEFAKVPHHLYSYVPLNEKMDIARYQKDCRAEIAEISSRHKVVLLVGGSGLYIRSALYDYDLSVDTSKVDLTPFNSYSDEELHAYLKKLDPLEASKLHPHNRLRVLRSISICLASGTSKTSLLAKQHHEPLYPTLFVALKKDRSSLYPQVDERVEKMFENGLLDETIPLIKKYGREAPAFRAIGIKELFPYLDKEISLEECKATIKEDTRHYIKRQETFLAHQFPIHYVTSFEDIMKLWKQ